MHLTNDNNLSTFFSLVVCRSLFVVVVVVVCIVSVLPCLSVSLLTILACMIFIRSGWKGAEACLSHPRRESFQNASDNTLCDGVSYTRLIIIIIIVICSSNFLVVVINQFKARFGKSVTNLLLLLLPHASYLISSTRFSTMYIQYIRPPRIGSFAFMYSFFVWLQVSFFFLLLHQVSLIITRAWRAVPSAAWFAGVPELMMMMPWQVCMYGIVILLQIMPVTSIHT